MNCVRISRTRNAIGNRAGIFRRCERTTRYSERDRLRANTEANGLRNNEQPRTAAKRVLKRTLGIAVAVGMRTRMRNTIRRVAAVARMPTQPTCVATDDDDDNADESHNQFRFQCATFGAFLSSSCDCVCVCDFCMIRVAVVEMLGDSNNYFFH